MAHACRVFLGHRSCFISQSHQAPPACSALLASVSFSVSCFIVMLKLTGMSHPSCAVVLGLSACAVTHCAAYVRAVVRAVLPQVQALLEQLQELLRRAEVERDRAKMQLKRHRVGLPEQVVPVLVPWCLL